jgi:hypothetical protein
MFWVPISSSAEADVQLWLWFKVPGYGVSAQALISYLADLNH